MRFRRLLTVLWFTLHVHDKPFSIHVAFLFLFFYPTVSSTTTESTRPSFDPEKTSVRTGKCESQVTDDMPERRENVKVYQNIFQKKIIVMMKILFVRAGHERNVLRFGTYIIICCKKIGFK